MAVLHLHGKAKRAQSLALAPIYFLFSSDTAAVNESLVIDRTKLLGGRKASQQLLVKGPDNDAGADGIIVSGVTYRKYSASNLSTLQTNGVHHLFMDVVLNASVVAAGQTVNSMYVVSYLEGVTPAGKEILTAAELQSVATKWVLEAPHNLTTGITVDGNLNKLLQMILEM